jgi:GWxTD domain-containing protein
MSLQAVAQLQGFCTIEKNYTSTEAKFVFHYAIKAPVDQSLTIHHYFYQNNLIVDSTIHYTNTQQKDYVGNYCLISIEQIKPIQDYLVECVIINESNGETLQIKKDLLMDIQSNKPSLGSMVLFSQPINKIKNTILIENFCDTSIQNIYYRVPIFNASLLKPNANFYIRITKKGKPNHILYSYVDTFKSSLANGYLFTSKIPLQNLVSGNYMISYSLFDNDILMDKKEIECQCIRPSQAKAIIKNGDEFSQAKLEVDETFIKKYDQKAMQRNILALKAITTAAQFQVIQQLVETNNDSLIRKYFYNFWITKNANYPQEAWTEYSNKLNHCLKYFNGIETDRSIIYLRYGKPDKTEDVPNEPNTIPYEIWQYEAIGTEANVVFLFIQSRGINDQKQLLHSTLSVEKHYPAWRNFLIAGDDNNNRALEYLQLDGSSK